MDFSIGCKSRMKILMFSSYLVPMQSKTTTLGVISYNINKRLILWLNVVPSSGAACLDSMLYEVGHGERLAEDTFWFSLSFSGEWIHVQANSGFRFRFVFNNCIMVWATTNPNVYAGATSLLLFPREENQRAFFNSLRKIWLDIGSVSHKCVSRNTITSNLGSNLVLCPFSMTDVGFIRSRSLYNM